MDIFPLYIFPTGSLASSVIPAVWVGMLVVCFFNLRLGWVLSGLVVPGYLVPLLLIKPWSAAVVLLEGIVTYFIIYFFSDYLSKKGFWHNLFGRDRFFSLILCSVAVRLLFDGWLLPGLGEWLNHYFQMEFDYRSHLHSFGLIIVSLIANQFWKTGIVKGFVPFVITLMTTLLIVRYGLMELTNFNLSSVSYLYNDLASSILASPKAYIILVSTAFLASRMNLYYGWDFNGILIPALLALQWYQPIRIVATIAEAAAILFLATIVLKSSWFKTASIEGARKLILFFNISFVYKILLGYFILTWFPNAKTTDYFGFGYVLATLMAVKIHDKAILARLTRATLQTSLTAVLVASIIGFSLTLLPITNTFVSAQMDEKTNASKVIYSEGELVDFLQKAQVGLFEVKANNSYQAPLAHEIGLFDKGLGYIERYLENKNPEVLSQANLVFNQLNYQVIILQQHYLVLSEKTPSRGGGIYVFNLKEEHSLALEVPAPLSEVNVMNAGITLFKMLNARSLSISGTSRIGNTDQKLDVLSHQHSFFHTFHRRIGRNDSIQVRTYTSELARVTAGLRRVATETQVKGLVSTLWVKRKIPESLNLVALKKLLGSYQLEWETPRFENRQRDVSVYGFGELILNQDTVKRLLFSEEKMSMAVSGVEEDISIEGYLHNWILSSKVQIAEQGSNLYQAPDLAQLLFLDEKVFTPLLNIVKNYQFTHKWTPEILNSLRMVARSADIMGYQVIRYRHKISQKDYLIVIEKEGSSRRYWGTYVLQVDKCQPYAVQIPRPLYEVNSFEYGVALFDRINAASLMIGTTHPHANADETADLVAPNNKLSVFNLFTQVLLRESKSEPLMILSSRAYSYRLGRPLVDADIIMAQTGGKASQRGLTELSNNLVEVLEADGLKVKQLDGSLETQGYEVSTNTQSYYLNATENKKIAVLWLSSSARSSYRQQDENKWQIAQFTQLGITSIEQDLAQYLLLNGGLQSIEITPLMDKWITQYVKEMDVVGLQKIKKQADTDGLTLKRVVDVNSKQAFLVLQGKNLEVFAVVNLTPRSLERFYLTDTGALEPQLKRFIALRFTWLLAGS